MRAGFVFADDFYIEVPWERVGVSLIPAALHRPKYEGDLAGLLTVFQVDLHGYAMIFNSNHLVEADLYLGDEDDDGWGNQPARPGPGGKPFDWAEDFDWTEGL